MLQSSNLRRKYRLTLPMLLSALTALAVLLTLCVTITASYQTQRDTLYNTTFQMNVASAVKMSETMNSLFRSMRASLRTTADAIAANPDMDARELFDQLEYARKTSGFFNSIVWSDETGVIQGNSPPSVGLQGKAIGTKQSIEALASRSSYLSAPYIVAATGRLIVLMGEPVYDHSGTYRGMVGGSIYLQEHNVLNAIFGNNAIDSSGSYFYVVDSYGKLVFHPFQNQLGEDVSDNSVVQQLLLGRSGSAMVANRDGAAFLAGYSSVPETGWGVVVQSPVETVRQQLNKQVRSTAFYMALPFLLIMLAAIIVARKLARPFAVLTDYIAQAAEGSRQPLPMKLNHWNREADVLTRTTIIAVEAMRKQSTELAQAALADPLTGLLNRRALENVLEEWSNRNMPFGLIMMDIDQFKCINDTLGHQVGDEVLKSLADVIKRSIRSTDICCRFGGEEFVVLLPRAGAEESVRLAERIRRTMEIEVTPADRVITVSLGVAAYPQHAKDAEQLFRLADEALYAAKEAGRNRTVLAEPQNADDAKGSGAAEAAAGRE